MFKKILLLLLTLSLTLGAFTLTASATDNPSTLHTPTEPTLAPRMTFYGTEDYNLLYRDRLTVYNPYFLNDFDFDEALYTYNRGNNSTTQRMPLLTNALYWYHEDEALSVDHFKRWHMDEYGKLYFINLVTCPSELETESEGAYFVLESDWFNFWSTSDTRNIGLYIDNNDDETYVVDITIYGYDVQTNDTDYVRRNEVLIDTAQYDKVPLASIISQLDESNSEVIYDYYRIKVESSDYALYPTEIGFMTPFTVSGGLYPETSSDVYVRDGLTPPSTTSVSYDDFDLLGWLAVALDGFFVTPLFTIGDVEISLGTCLGVTLGGWLFIVFLKKFAGG